MSNESTEAAHQQRIDEILSIYIQSDMKTGRKTNNLNLKISTNNSSSSIGSSSKPPRSVPVKLRGHHHSNSGPFKIPPPPISPTTTATATTQGPGHHHNNHTIITTSHHNQNSSNSSKFVRRHHSSSTTHVNHKQGAKVSFQKDNNIITSIIDRDGGGERERDTRCDREVESTLFHSLRGSPISENDEENDSQNNYHQDQQQQQQKQNEVEVFSTSPRRHSVTSPSSRRESPRISPPMSPGFYSDRTDNRDRRQLEAGPDPKESYARILATLKRIEEEERLNFGYPVVGNRGDGSGEWNEEILEKLKSLPNITSVSPPPQFYEQFVPSRPCTPATNNNNNNNHSSSPSPPGQFVCNVSPRNANSRFTTTTTTTTSSTNNIIMSSSGPASVTSGGGGISSQSTPRFPPLLDSPSETQPNGSSRRLDHHHNNFSSCDGPHSARSYPEEPIRLDSNNISNQRPATACLTQSPRWETTDEKAKTIFSYLDEIERSDRETLFHLKLDKSPTRHGHDGLNINSTSDNFNSSSFQSRSEFPNQTMDSLIRRGSVELAREVILLERKIEEYQHNVTVLEETLINQRELNMRHIKNSERDLKKRLKLQQEEFELALTRHQAFVDQLIAEKRSLQDKCEKVLRDLKDTEIKYQDQTKSLQEKHLEEIKRLRRIQESSEKVRRVKWMGNKTQEIRETTIKGLEPELQRVISRHQQEMSEMRAWHANELHEMEERCSRKLVKQAQEIREQMMKEKEESMNRDRELLARRHEAELEHLKQEIDAQKRRYLNELQDERQRFELEQQKVKDLIQENIRKVEIKAEVEFNSLKEQYETKLAGQERRHETELKTVSNVHEAERESYVANYAKKLEQAVTEKELILAQANKVEKEAEMEEREKKLRQEFDKQWKEQEDLYESRMKRLQEKFQAEITDFEETEKELKNKFSQVKAELIGKEEQLFSLKTTLSLKEKQCSELGDSNMKMMEERANLTAVVRREFSTQIESLEQDCVAVKASVIELKAKHKMELEQHHMDLDKVRMDKDNELEKVGQRVVQAMARKEETILELQKQLEKATFRVNHLEQLLEQQRKEFVKSVTLSTGGGSKNKNKK